MTEDSAQRLQRAREILSSDRPQALYELVSWLDIEMCSDDDDEEYASTAMQIYLRALLAVGYLLLGQCPPQVRDNIKRTLRAAEALLLDGTEQAFDALWTEATMSYPFGPGEGCFAIPETGFDDCAIGSGCTSSSGSLACQGLPPELVMESIREELIPWLEGTGDPAILRDHHA